MFPQTMADFEERVREVDSFFQLLAAIDNSEIKIDTGAGPQVAPLGPPTADWGRMLKGTAYLVLYNLVEAFIRRGFQAVFETIKNEGLCGAELSASVRSQWIMQKNRKVKTFDGSPKVYMKIADEIVGDIVSRNAARLSRDHLPFSGNLDADAIRDVCIQHGVDHRTPPAARGGAALETVKQKRNSLSHGDESFSECGRNVVVADLITAKDEIVAFMRAVLYNPERFASDKAYKL